MRLSRSCKLLAVYNWLLLFGSLILLGGCGKTPTLSSEPHHNGDSFRNLYIDDPDKNFFSFLRMRWFGDTDWADPNETAHLIPRQNLSVDRLYSAPGGLRVSWLGHSTFLLQSPTHTILTDPIFSDRASPVRFAGPERYTPHVVDYLQLPPVDFIVISHDHYDHLDAESVEMLEAQEQPPIWLVPLGLDRWFLDAGVSAERVVSLDWKDEKVIDSAEFIALPSQHWSARGLFDRMQTLWASWLIEIDGFRIWFGGDTGYNERLFQSLATQMPDLDLALIPIGAYSPRWFMAPYHLNPEEAVKVFQHLQPRFAIGMHWGTFPLTAEPAIEPLHRFQRARDQVGLKASQFLTLPLGGILAIDQKMSGL